MLLVALEAPLPPLNGLRLPLVHVWRHVRQRHEARLVGYRMPDQLDPAPPDVRLVDLAGGGRAAVAARLASATVRRRPLNADRFAAGLLPALTEELEQFYPDVVHVFSGRLAGVSAVLRRRPAVLTALDAWHLHADTRAAVSSGLRRRMLRAEAARVRRFEATTYRRFDRVTMVTRQDADALLEVSPDLRITVVPNGVDAGAFPHTATLRGSRIAFHGIMSYEPNVVAAQFLAREVLPRVRARRPEAHLVLVGREPAPEVRTLAALEGVTVTGGVDDVVPWLTDSRAYACPMLSGTGIKNKLLEAMATGLPCVVTPLAAQGLDVADGRELLVRTDVDAVAHGLLQVLDDDDLASSLGLAGRRYVVDHHSWEAVGRTYEALYREVLVRRGT